MSKSPILKRSIISQNDSKIYKQNFDVLTNDSFFNCIDKKVKLKFPCPNNNYTVKNVSFYSLDNNIKCEDLPNVDLLFGIRNIIFLICHITDGSTDSRRCEKMTHMIDYEIKFDEIISHNNPSQKFSIKENQGIVVIIYNNNKSIETKYKVLSDFRPDEAGGGVIVQYP